MKRLVVSLLLVWVLQPGHTQLGCEQVDGCSCEMSDGSGRIQLRSLARPDDPYRIDHSIFTFLYTPCQALHNASGECKDETSVCQLFKEGGLGYNYGTADSAKFSVDPETSQVRISYSRVDNNITRVSNVNLVCDPGQREKALFEFEWADPLLLNFKLTSVCACPGGCLTPTVTCSMKDSCTCDMSDGTGEINLHPLDNPWAPLRSSHLQPDLGRNFTYFYNPCSGLTFANTRCTNVSNCQVDTEAVPVIFYPLGHVAPESDPLFNQDDGSITLSYIGGDDGRHFDVKLICDPDQDVPEFTALGEPSRHYYYMTLKTRCACPGMCKNDPQARKARYLKWKASHPD